MAKVRKKYDRLSAQRDKLRRACQDMLVRKVHGHDTIGEPIHLKTGKPFILSMELVQELVTARCKWLVVLFVWGKESNGKLHLDTSVIRTKAIVQLDLNDYLTEQLAVMHDKAKYAISTDGYAAMPVPPDYVDDLTDNLLYLRIKEIIDRPEYYEPLPDDIEEKTKFT